MADEKSKTHVIKFNAPINIEMGFAGSFIDDCKKKMSELADDKLFVYVGLDSYIVVDPPMDSKTFFLGEIELRKNAIPSIDQYNGKSVYICEKCIQF